MVIIREYLPRVPFERTARTDVVRCCHPWRMSRDTAEGKPVSLPFRPSEWKGTESRNSRLQRPGTKFREYLPRLRAFKNEITDLFYVAIWGTGRWRSITVPTASDLIRWRAAILGIACPDGR